VASCCCRKKLAEGTLVKPSQTKTMKQKLTKETKLSWFQPGVIPTQGTFVAFAIFCAKKLASPLRAARFSRISRRLSQILGRSGSFALPNYEISEASPTKSDQIKPECSGQWPVDSV
jgi:hypothetical protein